MAHPHAAIILAVEGDAAGQTWRFQSSVPIGRGPNNVFSFPEDDSLEEQHTGIVTNGERWFCINSNPSAPTTIDGVALVERFTVIPSGSVVRCGRQAFRVLYREPGQELDKSLAYQRDVQGQAIAQSSVARATQRIFENFRRGVASDGAAEET